MEIVKIVVVILGLFAALSWLDPPSVFSPGHAAADPTRWGLHALASAVPVLLPALLAVRHVRHCSRPRCAALRDD